MGLYHISTCTLNITSSKHFGCGQLQTARMQHAGGWGIPPEPKGLVDATCVDHCLPSPLLLLASAGEVKSRPRRSSTDADCFLWLAVSAEVGEDLAGGVELPFVWDFWRWWK